MLVSITVFFLFYYITNHEVLFCSRVHWLGGSLRGFDWWSCSCLSFVWKPLSYYDLSVVETWTVCCITGSVRHCTIDRDSFCTYLNLHLLHWHAVREIWDNTFFRLACLPGYVMKFILPDKINSLLISLTKNYTIDHKEKKIISCLQD